MKIIFSSPHIFLLLLLSFSRSDCYNIDPLDTNLEGLHEFVSKVKPYQDIIANNTLFYKGWNTDYCLERYQVLADIFKYLNQGDPVKTVLDVGAAQGYFSFKLAQEFNIIPVMLEDGESSLEHSNQGLNLLKKLCQLNTLTSPHSTVIASKITHESLARLEMHAHFDVVIALSILHLLDNWQTALHHLIELGTVLIVEVPGTEGDITQIKNSKDLARINRSIETMGGVLIKKIPRRYKNQVGNLYAFFPEQPVCKKFPMQSNSNTQKIQSVPPLTFINFV